MLSWFEEHDKERKVRLDAAEQTDTIFFLSMLQRIQNQPDLKLNLLEQLNPTDKKELDKLLASLKMHSNRNPRGAA